MKSLKSKVVFLLLSVFILFGAGAYGIQRFIILPGFIDLERDEAQKDLGCSVEAIKKEIHHLDTVCSDWSSWDDTYNFVESRSREYIDSNLVLGTFTGSELNIIYILDKYGKVVWGEIYDLETEETLRLADFPKDDFPEKHPLISYKSGNRPLSEIKITGIFMAEQGPMLISSRPILTSNDEGPVRGSLIMGRFINEGFVKTLVDQTQVSFKVFPIQGNSLPEAIKEIPAQLTNQSPYLIEKKGDDHLMIHTSFPDIKGKAALLISAKIPRKISAKGYTVTRYVLISISISALVVLIAMLLFLHRIVLNPITDLTDHALSIGKSGDLSERLSMRRKDEIGTLAREFDAMLANLEKQTEELIEVNKKLQKDIVKRKQAEEALRESEEKLNRLKKMEAIGLLAGGVAHDLNNILSGIVSYPDLLLIDNTLAPKYRKIVKRIRDSGKKAAAVVSDLLTVARGIASDREVVNLNDIIKEYLLSPEYREIEQVHPSATVKTDFDSELLNINGSPVHIRKAVMNLVSNAFEAIPGEGTVVISTRSQYIDEPLEGYEDVCRGEYAVVSVSDNGPGISPDHIDRIFEPFYTKKIMGRSGTGLGLAVVWNTVQDHDGCINVRSGEKGTIFDLFFPITRDKTSVNKEQIPPEHYTGNGERILVVDDEESQREIAYDLLTQLDYSVEAVSSGEEAVEYLRKQTVDLVVLDMVMPPGINGRETYERIAQIYPGQKAIIASGFSETVDVKRAQRLGAGRYIKKPYTLEKIGIAVKSELEE